ncbi:MAG: hypothetical protein GY834_06840 [Bacteroidetes bacterium]|nr:hypothetical protein [Bacteroidota bacterium]
MKEPFSFRQILYYPFGNIWMFILENILLTFLIIVFFFSRAFISFEVFILNFIWGFSICITQWVGHVYIIYRLRKSISILKYPKKRIALGLVFMVLYSVIAFILIQFLMRWVINGTFDLNEIYEILESSYYAFAIAVFLSLIFSAYGYLQGWRKTALNAEKLKAEMLAYKYEALRNQINPHFLFNSFNVLSDLIYDDKKQAVRFVQQMSVLFRYVLDSRDKELVPLREEMEFIKSYTFLLKIRFENKVEIVDEIKTEEDDLIVPMSLQLLIENAVKHNEASSPKPLKIELIRNKNHIEVKNNLQAKNVGDSSNGVGMKNIHQQYKFFTDEQIKTYKSDEAFSVSIPILKADKE